MLPFLILRIKLNDKTIFFSTPADTWLKIRWFKFPPVAMGGDSLNGFKKKLILVLLLG